MDNIKADILISVYDTAYFEQSLKSALNQKMAESVIVCDNTNDNTAENISAKYACRKLIYFKPQTPLKRYAACIELVKMSKSPWLRFLDDCEILTENSLEKRLEQSRTFGGISMTFSSYITVAPNGKKERTTYNLPEYVKGTDYLFNIFHEEPITKFTNVLIRRSVATSKTFMNLPKQTEIFPAAAVMLAMTEGDLVYTAESMVQRLDTVPKAHKDTDAMLDDTDCIIDVLAHIKTISGEKKRTAKLRKELIAELFRQNMVCLIKEKRYRNAWEYALETIQTDIPAVAGAALHISVPELIARGVKRILRKFRKAS